MWLKRLRHDVEHHVCTGVKPFVCKQKNTYGSCSQCLLQKMLQVWGSEIKVAYRIRGLCPRIEVANFLVCTKNEAANP